jgi:membrane associated rhomboid family serine protease
VLTVAVATLTAGVSILGLAVHPVELALRRDGPAISSGEIWRLLSSLLVQDGGAIGTIFNLAGLVVIGIAAERRLGRPRWMLAYLVGGLTGELVGWAGWQPIGAGNSVAVCGLAGALAIASWQREAPRDALEATAPAVWATALAAGTLTFIAPLAATLIGQAVAAGRAPRTALQLCVVGPSALLIAQEDIHGAALAAGLAFGLVSSQVAGTPNRARHPDRATLPSKRLLRPRDRGA